MIKRLEFKLTIYSKLISFIRSNVMHKRYFRPNAVYASKNHKVNTLFRATFRFCLDINQKIQEGVL